MILKVNGERFEFFDDFTLKVTYDSIASGFSIGLNFNPNNPKHREIMRVGAYPIATIIHNDQTILTGYIANYKFYSESEPKAARIGGYSLTGILEDCQVPTDIYPLQTEGLTLTQIAEKLVEPFGLTVNVDGWVVEDMSKPYDFSSVEVTQSIKDYLSELASQRNIVLSHTVFGSLLFTRALIENQIPVLSFDGSIPQTKMSLTFDGQKMHSSITVLKDAQPDGGNSCQDNINNPYIEINKTSVTEQTSGDDNDTFSAARRALAKELKNIKLEIETDRWEIDGKLLMPNNLIEVKNPDVYLYNNTKWFIESVDFKGTTQGLTATLHCVLPEVYSNQIPERAF